MACHSPLKGWRDDETGGIVFKRSQGTDPLEVACGQCLGCRLDYSRMWAMRISHEAALWESEGGNCFITLTYRSPRECTSKQLTNKQHIPDDWSLHKKDLQLFFKRLRKRYDDKTIRFYAAGEYGAICKHGINLKDARCELCNVGRPHYHVALFNHTPTDLEIYGSQYGEAKWTSPEIEEIWGKGFIDVSELNYDSANYIASYILKKMRKDTDPNWYQAYDMDGEITFLTPEFTLMSRGNKAGKKKACGIGAEWFNRYQDDFYPSDETPVPGKGVMPGTPRYYLELLKQRDQDAYENIKNTRRIFKENHAEDYTHQRLKSKHIIAKAKLKLKETQDR